jgi:hypothetical protein
MASHAPALHSRASGALTKKTSRREGAGWWSPPKKEGARRVRLDQVIHHQRLPAFTAPINLSLRQTRRGGFRHCPAEAGTSTFVDGRRESLACSCRHPLLARHSLSAANARESMVNGTGDKAVESGELFLSREGA